MAQQDKMVVFNGKNIRRVFHLEEWWFSVIDVVGVLTDSLNSRDYWFKMKTRVKTEEGLELSTICRQFKLKASDGKMRETDCANTHEKNKNIARRGGGVAGIARKETEKEIGRNVTTHQNYLDKDKTNSLPISND
jgi:prophage antirepressor-like protein